ncbi:MAG TPA: hypothetical protein VK911_03235 [Vicinamibacterales bacterium]|nr:hypothetical protein [Vicinamibacterales bacterium]
MVHALRRVAGMVVPGGRVIDVRSLDERAEFLVGPSSCGHLRETDEGIEYRQAELALQTALAAGVFTLESEHPFSFRHYAPGLAAMREYLAATWKDAVILPEVAHAVEAALAEAEPGAEVVLRETGWMRVLRPLRSA